MCVCVCGVQMILSNTKNKTNIHYTFIQSFIINTVSSFSLLLLIIKLWNETATTITYLDKLNINEHKANGATAVSK